MTELQEQAKFTIGTTAEWKGQTYRLEDIRPHRTRRGYDTVVMVWRSRCLECGASFTATTTRAGLKYPNRRCQEHVQKRAKHPAPLPQI
jgi:hypothetical protein